MLYILKTAAYSAAILMIGCLLYYVPQEVLYFTKEEASYVVFIYAATVFVSILVRVMVEME